MGVDTLKRPSRSKCPKWVDIEERGFNVDVYSTVFCVKARRTLGLTHIR